MKDGILNVYKPQGWTSHDVVALLRGLTGVKKAGHTGTLDPMATGTLPVCIGKATRVIEYLDEDRKVYHCGMKLGLRTDTLDIWGRTLEEEPAHVSEPDAVMAARAFVGEQEQTPPLYSALKVRGRRLYSYARAGEEVDIQKRKVRIDEIGDVLFDEGAQELSFTCRCSRGTYIRALCRDIGASLGTFGTMTALERLASGPFKAEDAVSIEDIRGMEPGEIEALIRPADRFLIRHGAARVSAGALRRFVNGNVLDREDVLILRQGESDRYNMYDEDGRFLGISVYDGREFRAKKVLAAV